MSLGAIALTFGSYFVVVATSHRPGPDLPNLPQLALFAATVVVQVLILIVGHITLAIRSPEEAKAPADERDRAIEHRAIRSAYYVLISGMILVGCVMPFSSGGWTIINAAIFMIVAAELVHYGMVVLDYRRQA